MNTSMLSLPRQIIFKNSGKLYIFFDGSLQGYGACIYVEFQGQVNLLTSTAKTMGKSAYSAPQSEISSTSLAVKMHQKINLELHNTSFSDPVFIGDSEIVLKMIARKDPASLPIIYGTRIMEIRSQTTADNWMWCPEPLNPADLLTMSGSTLEKINSDFWLRGSFLLYPVSTWPTKPCASLISSNLPSAVISRISTASTNPLTNPWVNSTPS